MTSYVDKQEWPDTLAAHVVDDCEGAPPRIHGYDVESDLARHYPFSTTVVLALTGELPDGARAAAEQTYAFYGPIMQGMSGTGTAVAIGANCTFRRKALAEWRCVRALSPGITH